MKLKSISQSKLKTWEYCRAGFYYQYVLGISGYNPNFEGGTDYHTSVELYHKGLDRQPRTDHRGNPVYLKIKFNDEVFEVQDQDIYNPELIKHYRGDCDCEGKLAHDSIAAGDALKTPEGRIMVEERLTNVYLEHPKTGKALMLPMTLVIDRVASMDKLSDLKTSNVAWNQNQVDKDIQATIYSYAWWQLYGVIPEFEFVVVRKNPGPRTKALDILTTNRDIADFAEMWVRMDALITEIERATEYPCTCFNREHARMGLIL